MADQEETSFSSETNSWMSTRGESSKGKERSVSIDVEEHLIHAQLGVRQLKKKVNKLEKENTRLRHELENDRVLSSQPKHSGSTTDDDTNLEELAIRDLEKEVENLKQTVSTTEKENHRLRTEIEDLRKGSLKEEVDDLQTPKTTDGEIDPVYRMRKLLRKFSDLMLASTTSDDMKEECPICSEPFKVKECSALSCSHLICHVCLPKISRAASRDTEALRCPQCRQDTPREELELIHMTETDRWDKLTKVAQAWIAFDRRGELETSDEEDEEDFITDGNGTSEGTSEPENHDNRTMDDTPAQDALPSIDQEEPRQASPLSTTSILFSDSPTKLKRKRMEELAAERSQRKRT